MGNKDQTKWSRSYVMTFGRDKTYESETNVINMNLWFATKYIFLEKNPT